MKILTVLFSLVLSATAFAGGSDSGGGNVCYPAGGKAPVALDLVTDGAEAGVAPADFPTSFNLNLPKSDFAKKFQFDVVPYQLIYLENTDFQKFVLGLLRISGKSSYTAQILMMGLVKLNFVVVEEEFKSPRRAFFGEQTECTPANTRAVIVYKNGMMYLSRPLWNKLPYGTQATILIHEILRNVQSSSDLNASDRDLQNLTAHLAANVLRKGVSMDRHPFLADHSPYWNGVFPNLKSGVNKVVTDPDRICADNGDVAKLFQFETAYEMFCEGLAREKILFFDIAIMTAGLKGISQALEKADAAKKLSPNEKRLMGLVSDIESDFDLRTIFTKTDPQDYRDTLKPEIQERWLKLNKDYMPVEDNLNLAKDVARYKIEDDQNLKTQAARDFVKVRARLKQTLSDY